MVKEAGMDFKHKEVINITDAKRLGFVQDVCADLESGRITSIIVPGNRRMISMFNKEDDIVISWDKIRCIGEDIILVEM
ncbi:MAG: YlmC/YmxH family sporulation protein [Clostridia bacterium]|nr:YlmC/YmxH family sporulation protein [Clostridia bacterium]